MALQFKSLLAMVRKPYFGIVPMFAPNTDLSWIPSVGYTQIAAANAAETPDGVRTTFTFPNPPQYIIYNGQTLVAVTDFTVVGNVATMPTAPETGADFYGWV